MSTVYHLSPSEPNTLRLAKRRDQKLSATQSEPNLYTFNSFQQDAQTDEDDDDITDVDEDSPQHKVPIIELPYKTSNKSTACELSNMHQPQGIHPYHKDFSHHHPTSPMSQQGKVENSIENNFEGKSRRPSQLLQERASLNALCPPSHALKARRLSKNIVKPSTSTPLVTPSRSTSSIRDSRKSSISESYKEFNTSSAVSPRFMALRKLSEVTALPSHSVSYSTVPPVPQLPLAYQHSAEAQRKEEKPGAATVSNDYDLESRLLSRIDDVLETQLQFHLGQIVWKASESHMDARRFWEEQKKEMFGFAANLIERMEAQVDVQRRMTLESISSPVEPLSLASPPSSITGSQLLELQSLKTRNEELERQLKEMKEALDKAEALQYSQEDKLKKHPDSSNNNSIAAVTPSADTILNGTDGNEDTGKKMENWADIMESEDEAKKSAEEWAQKYQDLQTSYFEVCLKLESKQGHSDDDKRIYDLQQSMSEKDEIIRHLKQAQDINKIEMNRLQSELSKYQRQQRPPSPPQRVQQKEQISPSSPPQKQRRPASTVPTSEQQGYVAEDGYLTFTTQINGQLSKYTIKIPTTKHEKTPPSPQSKKQTRHSIAHKPMSHLNPNAAAWKSKKS